MQDEQSFKRCGTYSAFHRWKASVCGAGVSEERLVIELVTRAFGWRPAADRYFKPHRGWITRSRFRPIEDVGDAFRVLDAVGRDYSLAVTPTGPFTAGVSLGGRTGKAAGEQRARVICLTLAQALGLEMENG